MLRIGSRESRLAVVQAELVMSEIKKIDPSAEAEIVTMKTTGDKRLEVSLDKIGGKGLFVKELDSALMKGKIDLAVHSLKDMPMEENPELPILAFSEREDPRDVLVLREGLGALPENPVIGSSSRRRSLQAGKLLPGASFKPIRGNVITRMEKLDRGEFDGIILAAAGLKRLGLEGRISRYFSIDEVIPPAGQGILAVQGRKNSGDLVLSQLNCPDSQYAAQAERAFVRTLNGGCSVPIAAYACKLGGKLNLKALYYLPQKGDYVTGEVWGDAEDAEKLGEKLAFLLKARLTGGKVWLVGAGPGDSGLLTVKGKRILEEAEVILYDALVGEGVFSYFPQGAEIIFAGKRAGNHTLSQEEINRLLLEKALEGKRVVRLKGGDPFLFGRGGEEMEVLKEYGIPYEVVPGVPSAISALAYAGIPVTHRNLSSSVHIISGHGKEFGAQGIPYEALVRLGGTLVFLMGLGSLREITAGLLQAGMNPDIPAAVIESGTTARQRSVTGTLSDIFFKVSEQKVKPPAIFAVGEVCRLGDGFGWAGSRPLNGKRIIVTRPRALQKKLSESLRDLGAEVIELPSVETVPVKDGGVDNILKALEAGGLDYRWMVFTSPSGVRIFKEKLRELRVDVRTLAGIRLAAIGSATKEELEGMGLMAEYVPEIYTAAHLGRGLAERIQGLDQALILRAKNGSPDLTMELDKKGIKYAELPLYETVPSVYGEAAEKVKALYRQGGIDYVVFTSSSGVRGFASYMEKPEGKKVFALCIGEKTAETARNCGFIPVVSGKAEMESLIIKILECEGK